MAAHKFVISFSFGLELTESGTRKALHVIYISTFAAMSALGIGIGIAISESAAEGKTYVLTTATLQGKLATST